MPHLRQVVAKNLAVRHAAMLILAGAFLSMSFLGCVDLLEYTIPTSYAFIAQAANGDFWTFVHALCGVFIIVAIFRDNLYKQAMSAAAGFMFGWSFFNLVWGLSTVDGRHVSLAGPVLGFGIAGGAYIMAIAPLPPPSGGPQS